MKKSISILGLLAVVIAMTFALSSYTRTESPAREKSCTLTVKYGNGDPADYVTVTTSSSHGQHDFKTNDKGVVTLTWEYAEIKCLYIKGNKYEVNYEEGKSYTLTLKQNNKYS